MIITCKRGRVAVVCVLFVGVLRTLYAAPSRMESALSHYILAVICDRSGQHHDAIREFHSALKYDVRNPVVYTSLAAAYLKTNNLSNAEQQLLRAVELSPEASEPHAMLAMLLSAQHKEGQAQVEYELFLKKAAQLQPGNVDIYKRLGFLYVQQRNIRAAQQMYELVVHLAPCDAEAHFHLASVLDELPGRDEIIIEKHLLKAIELNPQYDEALNYLGFTYAQQGRNLVEAETLIRKALQAESSNPAYIDSLGWVYFKQGKLKESLEKLQRARSLIEDPEIYDHLGDVYQALGDIPNARAAWKRALQLAPYQFNTQDKINTLGSSHGATTAPSVRD